MRGNDPVKSNRFWIHIFNNDSHLCHRFVVTFWESETINIFEALAYIPAKLLWQSLCPVACFIWYFYPVTFSHQFIKLKVRWPVPASYFFTNEPCTASHLFPLLTLSCLSVRHIHSKRQEAGMQFNTAKWVISWTMAIGPWQALAPSHHLIYS